MIKGIIFDLDGVLVSTDELHYQAWKRMCDVHEIYFDRRINQELRGISRLESLEVILKHADRFYSDQEKIELATQKNNFYCELIKVLSAADLLPGAFELLREIRSQNHKIAIASSSKNALEIITRLELINLIDVLVDGNNIHRSKPDPEIFLLAASRIDICPSQCIVIEDASSGIEAALAAGMAVIGIGDHLAGNYLKKKSIGDLTIQEIVNYKLSWTAL